MSFDPELLRRRGVAIAAAGLLALGAGGAVGCGDDNNGGVDDQIENAADDAGDKIDQAAGDASDKLDQAGEDIGNAANDAKDNINDAVNGDDDK